MPKCGARTQQNKLCRNPVRQVGDRCSHHRGMPAKGPLHPKPQRKRAAKPAARRQTSTTSSSALRSNGTRRPRARQASSRAKEHKRQKRIEKAVKVAREVATDSWQATVADRATEYVTDRTWKKLFAARRSGLCKALAELAAETLATKKKLHSAVGWVAAWFAKRLGGGQLAVTVARELAENLPLPVDVKFTAVARGVQLTGIMICLAAGQDLTRCPCFVDLALSETKERLKKILAAAVDDWAGLAGFPASIRAATE
jgi:hypothetical protein